MSFSKNDYEAMMNRRAAQEFRIIADHCEEHNYSAEQIIRWLKELADEADAQAIVVDLRDKI